MKTVSTKLHGHVSEEVQGVVESWPLVVAGIVTASVLLFCCLACCVVCVICRYRRRIQDASRRRRVAKSERRIDKARLTPDAPSHAKRGKPGTRVAPGDEDDPPPRRRNIPMILQPPRKTRSLVPSDEDGDELN